MDGWVFIGAKVVPSRDGTKKVLYLTQQQTETTYTMTRMEIRDGNNRIIREGDQVAPHPRHTLRWTVWLSEGEWVATLNNSSRTTYLYVGTWWVMPIASFW